MGVKSVDGAGKKELEIALGSIKGWVGKSGWVAEKKYPDSEMTTAEVAAITETGSPAKNIPARPVVAPAINSHQQEWGIIIESETKKVFEGQQTGKGVLEKVTLVASGQIRENITKLVNPPLSIKTIKAREQQYAGRRKTRAARKKQIAQRITSGKLDKPLVFTKYFLNSCTNAVEKE